ncbi:MAG TPA: alkaline phosphatase family protein [Kofleriaceae bacterium]|nr:alkaline phosphatase family protein [Kofleriaceae bacterium]
MQLEAPPSRTSRFVRALVLAATLGAVAWGVPHVRHRWIAALITYDAVPSEPVMLPPATGAGLPPAARVRVILIDGLAPELARDLPSWQAVCDRGARLIVDVGFPTVSLPVEVELWSGLTQQQTGIVFRSDQPLVPPLAGIPSQIAGSRAIAEDHGWIVRSLGFAEAEPAKDADPIAWSTQWLAHARDAVTSDTRLAFVHVLRVDTAGHHGGRDSPGYAVAAGSADAILGALVAAAPDARWFVVTDHSHLPGGGHGGEERELRQVEGCIAGPGVPRVHGGPVHVVDVARALAESTGATLDRGARGRPLGAALAAPLGRDQSVPVLPLGRGALALAILVVGLALGYMPARRWWLAPWWFAVGIAVFVAVHGEPTLSMPMVWAPAGRAMYVTWLPALALAAVTTWFGGARVPLARVVVAQLGLPFAAVAAAVTASGAWPLLAGAHVAPVVPHFTAWLSPLALIAAHGAAAVALAVLGRSVRSAFGRPSRPETPRSEPAAA